jgi:hypothetical protein
MRGITACYGFRMAQKAMQCRVLKLLALSAILLMLALPPNVWARNVFTPWSEEVGFQNLVYGSSTSLDVQRVMGRAADQIVKSEQMMPIVENWYYFEEGGSGAATLFVFENNLLVGLHYKSRDNQLVDLTYFLPNNGDRRLNAPALGGYASYSPYFPFYEW